MRKRFRLPAFGVFGMESVLILTALAILLAVSYIPIAINFRNAPGWVQYMGNTEYPLDFYGTLESVRDGYLGHWNRVSKVTSVIPGVPNFLRFEYATIGQFGRLLGLDTMVTYYLSRTIISLIVLLCVYLFIHHTLTDRAERIAAWWLSLFCAGFTFPGNNWGVWTAWRGDAIVFSRLTLASHHYLLGYAFTLLSLYSIASFFRDPRKRWWKFWLAAVAGLFTSEIHMPSTVLLLLTFSPGIVLYTLTAKPSRRLVFFNAFWSVVYGTVTVMPLPYLKYVSQFWDYSMFARTEHLMQVIMNPSTYLQGVGLVYVVALFSVPFVLRRRSPVLYMLLFWLVVHPFTGIVLADIAGFTPTRIFFTPYFVAFGILAAIALKGMGKSLSAVFRKNIDSAAVICGVCVILGSSWWTYRQNILNHSLVSFNPNYVYNYGFPDKSQIEAIYWLRDHTQEREIVLSGLHSGTIIPALAGNYVYASWWLYLSGHPDTWNIITPGIWFFQQQLSVKDAKKFVDRNNISYVFFGQDEKGTPDGVDELTYPFLKKVYENMGAKIYSVQR